MADWAIGDLHGCADEFDALLELIEFDQRTDTLWLTGDLINRGPHCLATLRRVHALHQLLGERLQVVLGNHDLHLLGCWLGVRAVRDGDTLGTILSAPDCDQLCQWLRKRPLVHVSGNHILVHAGLFPLCSIEDNLELAHAVHSQLAGDHPRDALHQLFAKATPTLVTENTLASQLAFAATVFTRMRCLNSDGTLNFREKGSPESLPEGVQPWFSHATPDMAQYHVFTGHWAALGYGVHGPVVALDGGCVWGGDLVAVRRDAPHQPYRVSRGSARATT